MVANQTIQQLDEGKEKELYEIEVKFQLTLLKSLHTQWLTDLYNLMTSAKWKNIVLKGGKLAGIIQAIQKGLRNLPGLNPFSDIFQIIKLDTVEPNLRAVIDKTAEDLEVLMMMMTTRKCMESTIMRFMFLMTILLMRQTKCNMLLLSVLFSSFFIFLYRKLLNSSCCF